MKVLILGGDGMLGHQLLLTLAGEHEVFVTLKEERESYRYSHIFNEKNSYFGVNLLDDFSILTVILKFKPDVIINASGVIKYRPKAEDKVYSLKINSLLPHRLAMIANSLDIKLITFSTDCVFSGKKGNYSENDPTDVIDIYGQTKFAGEIGDDEHCLTLRTSFFGTELKYYTGLIEWFLKTKGNISGYTKAIYSGISTFELSRLINTLLKKHPNLYGLYHVASEPINKYDLLTMLKNLLGRNDIEITPDNTVAIDRSLNSTKFNQMTGYCSPDWKTMLTELSQLIKIRGSDDFR